MSSFLFIADQGELSKSLSQESRIDQLVEQRIVHSSPGLSIIMYRDLHNPYENVACLEYRDFIILLYGAICEEENLAQNIYKLIQRYNQIFDERMLLQQPYVELL